MRTAVKLNETAPQLSLIRAVEGDLRASAILANEIDDFQEDLNVSQPMNARQIKNAGMLLIEKFWMLNTADIHAIFNMARMGEFGTIYNRLDITILSEWFSKYTLDKGEQFAMQQMQISERSKD